MDVAIVVGGIVGIMAATFLKEAGKTVALLEATRLAEGVTAHTPAKLTSLHTLIYDQLIGKVREGQGSTLRESNQAAIAIVKQVSEERALECEFKETTAYTDIVNDYYVSKIEKEAEAARSRVARRLLRRGAVAIPGEGRGWFHEPGRVPPT